MADRYTHRNLSDVPDSAPEFGFEENQEARFATGAMEAEQTGLSFHRVKPDRRQGFGHNHAEAEEVYVVLGGSGRMKLDDEVIDLAPRDAIRVEAPVTRCFEAGPDGLEILAFGPHRPDDRGEILIGWWSE
jgi:mannose-6-phosphate isomerase-like protein (cupin superfamily)